MYCINHPQKETSLRCNKCERPICPKCAVQTPTGYRCKQCISGQQKSFDTARTSDYLISIIAAGILSFIGSRVIPAMGFFTIFLSPIAGVIIAESVRLLIKRRRSKQLYKLIAVATALGSLPFLATYIYFAMLMINQIGFGGISNILPIVWQIIYSFTVTTTTYYRLSGISIKF